MGLQNGLSVLSCLKEDVENSVEKDGSTFLTLK